jgi:hypothetical protein
MLFTASITLILFGKAILAIPVADALPQPLPEAAAAALPEPLQGGTSFEIVRRAPTAFDDFGLTNLLLSRSAVALSERALDNIVEVASPSAGLAWIMEKGPVKAYLTNAHTGYAGPKVGNAYHTNFHVDIKNSKGKFQGKVNIHITQVSVSTHG